MKGPKGFRFSIAKAGFRKSPKNDVALIVSECPATAAGTFTLNKFPAAPVIIGKQILTNSTIAQAILINSGQANACTGEEGLQNCLKTLQMLAHETGINKNTILPASTGVIGSQFNMELWEKIIPILVERLGKASANDIAKAIITTDAFPKVTSKEISIANKTICLTGIAKGAGMVCPNMATMLAFILCDADIEHPLWHKLLSNAVNTSFNRITVDGDTSTNDTVYGLTNGCSGISITEKDPDSLALFSTALNTVLSELAYMLVQDGEGTTKVAHIKVYGAKNNFEAEQVARTVGHSQLVKTALFGEDANWGRIVAAIGRSGADFNPQEVSVSICGFKIFHKGQPTSIDFDNLLKEPLSQRDIPIDIKLGDGIGVYTILTSDLGHNYISCNSSYRS